MIFHNHVRSSCFISAVLSDPEKRAIYDVYGEKGLEAEWDLIPRTRTPQEIREEYERLAQEREERRLQQSTNPRVCTDESLFAIHSL